MPERAPLDGPFSSILQWRHKTGSVTWEGERWEWTKDKVFDRFIDLPAHVDVPMVLTARGIQPTDSDRLRAAGWDLSDAALLDDPAAYRNFIHSSHAEFSVTKDRYVLPRTGWFSDRTVCYLASGLPAVVQDTGLVGVPTGVGIVTFTNLEEAVEAVRAVARDHGRHAEAAAEIAQEYFEAERVLGDACRRSACYDQELLTCCFDTSISWLPGHLAVARSTWRHCYGNSATTARTNDASIPGTYCSPRSVRTKPRGAIPVGSPSRTFEICPPATRVIHVVRDPVASINSIIGTGQLDWPHDYRTFIAHHWRGDRDWWPNELAGPGESFWHDWNARIESSGRVSLQVQLETVCEHLDRLCDVIDPERVIDSQLPDVAVHRVPRRTNTRPHLETCPVLTPASLDRRTRRPRSSLRLRLLSAQPRSRRSCPARLTSAC